MRGVAQLGKYALVAEIARGGMGIIYLAQTINRLGFKKLVIVKELKPELADDDKFREMFLDEARLAARLNHRNIVQTLEVDQDDDRYFFVMEYLEGQTLHHVSRLKGDKALSAATFIRVVCDTLAGLHYAHELADFDGKPFGIVHRDVSPRNVFITYDSQVKLLDFGVAKSAGRDQETETGELKGRVPYMAPEHVAESKIDRRADIFSTGVLLREALTGKRLWDGSNEVEILRELLQKRVPPLPKDSGIDDDARAIIEKAMAPDPDDRFRTAHEMRSELERYVFRVDPTGSFGQVGEHISKEFAKHRAQVKTMIEDHVARVESTPPEKRASLPVLSISVADLIAAAAHDAKIVLQKEQQQQQQSNPSDPSSRPTNPVPPRTDASSPSALRASPPTATSAASSSGASGAVSAASSSSSPLIASAASAAPSSAMTGSSPSAPKSSIVTAAAAVPSSTLVKDISIPPPPRKSALGTYFLLALGFSVLVVALTALFLSTGEPPKTTKLVTTETTSTTPAVTGRRLGAQPSASASSTNGTNNTTSDEVEVTIHAFPAVAWISIDGLNVGEGPYTAKYKRGTKHFIKVSAQGYVTKTETLEVNATSSVNISLEREAGAAPPVIINTVRPHPPQPNPGGRPPAPPQPPTTSAQTPAPPPPAPTPEPTPAPAPTPTP